MLKLPRLTARWGRGRPEDGRRMWSARVLAKYWAMQLPGTAIVLAVLFVIEDGLGWPRWALWAIVLAWVAKDAALYPLTWRSYDSGYPTASPYRLEGATGIVVERVDSAGTVRVAGELWRAETAHGGRPIEEGERVLVRHQRGLVLLIEPAEER